MKVTAYDKKEQNTAELTIEVEAALFNTAVDNVYKKMRGNIAVPGFRKGKAPRKIIENMYGTGVFYNDALDDVIPAACAFGVQEKGIRIVGTPSLVDVNINDDKSVVVTVSVALYPEVKIGEYKGLKATKPSTEVPDSAVDAEVESLRLRNATIEVVDRPAIGGDKVLLDYSGSVDGVLFDGGTAQDHELEIGSNSFIKGFEEQVQGLKAGEEADINVTFPDEYHAPELAGKPAVFHVKVKEVRCKVLPEADDEFAKDVSEFDTIADYRADIREKLVVAREVDAQNWFENELLERLGDTVKGDIPEAMFEEQVDTQLNQLTSQLSQYGIDADTYFKMSGTTMADFRKDARPQAERQVRVSLALEKVVEKEKLKASEEEIAAFYADMAEQYGVTEDVVKASIDEEAAGREVAMRSAIKLVVDNGVVVEKVEEAKPKKTTKKKADAPADEAKADTVEKPKKATTAKTTTTKTTAAKKPAASKTADKAEPAAKKPAAKTATKAAKPAAEKAEKATAAKKPAASKTEKAAEKKPAAKKPAAKKAETTAEVPKKAATTKKKAEPKE